MSPQHPTFYQQLEANPRFQKLMKILDVGMLTSFHLPTMHWIFASKFGWGASIAAISLLTAGLATTPLGLIIGISFGAMALTIATRLPVLFPDRIGKPLKAWAKTLTKDPNAPMLKTRVRLRKIVDHVLTPAESRVTTQKTVGLSLLATGGLSLLSGGSAPEASTAGALYGGLSGKSNWTQGWRFEIENRNKRIAENNKARIAKGLAPIPQIDMDEALYSSPSAKWLSGNGLWITVPVALGLTAAAIAGAIPAVPAVMAVGLAGVFAGMRSKTFGKMANFPPLLAGLSMTVMGLAMTAKEGATFSTILQTALNSPTILTGTALFLSASAFQALRLNKDAAWVKRSKTLSKIANWGPAFGRVLSGTGMAVVAAFTLATMPAMGAMGAGISLAALGGSAIAYVAGKPRVAAALLGVAGGSAMLTGITGAAPLLSLASLTLSSASALSNYLVARVENLATIAQRKAEQDQILQAQQMAKPAEPDLSLSRPVLAPVVTPTSTADRSEEPPQPSSTREERLRRPANPRNPTRRRALRGSFKPSMIAQRSLGGTHRYDSLKRPAQHPVRYPRRVIALRTKLRERPQIK